MRLCYFCYSLIDRPYLCIFFLHLRRYGQFVLVNICSYFNAFKALVKEGIDHSIVSDGNLEVLGDPEVTANIY